MGLFRKIIKKWDYFQKRKKLDCFLKELGQICKNKKFGLKCNFLKDLG